MNFEVGGVRTKKESFVFPLSSLDIELGYKNKSSIQDSFYFFYSLPRKFPIWERKKVTYASLYTQYGMYKLYIYAEQYLK